MQAGGVVKLGHVSHQLMVPAKVVPTTSAADLIVPLQLFIPVKELAAMPLHRPVLLVLNADSFRPNKLCIRHLAEQVRHPVHDALCFGHS